MQGTTWILGRNRDFCEWPSARTDQNRFHDVFRSHRHVSRLTLEPGYLTEPSLQAYFVRFLTLFAFLPSEPDSELPFLH